MSRPAPTGQDLINQLKEAIEVLKKQCKKNASDFLHLPEQDDEYFNRLEYYIDAAVKLEGTNEKYLKAKEIISKDHDSLYFENVANEILNVLE